MSEQTETTTETTTEVPTEETKVTPEAVTEEPKVDTQPEPEAKKEDTTEAKPDAPKDDTEDSQQENGTVDSQINDLVKSFISNDGKLTDDEKAELTKTGLSEELFLALANGVELTQQANDQKVFDSVGGKEVYDSMLAFAAENFSDEQKTAFNDALFSGNEHLAQLAVAGLKATMESVNKAPQRRVEGGPTTVESGFSSQQELISAMNNNKYGRDINYTKEVDAKRSKTSW